MNPTPRDDIQDAARRAFAAGWAASGGPLTERVRTACQVAVTLALESADDPGVFHATVDLGRLEGTWALLFARRETLHARHAAAVAAAWGPLLRDADLPSAAARFRAEHGLAEADNSSEDRDDIKAAALAAALAMLSGLADHPGWADLRAALRDAIRAGHAEGMVAAVALAAEQVGQDGLDWDTGFRDAYAALDQPELTAQADTWLGRLVRRAATALARILVGDRDEDPETAASGDDIDGFVTDWAMTSAAATGALALYRSLATPSVDIITVGDGRVCAACSNAETASPWPLSEVPQLPLHPACRCSYAAALDLAQFAAWFT